MTESRVLERTRSLVVWLDRGILALARHWLALANGFLAVFVALPYLAPLLMARGYTLPAEVIYTAYKFVCHQLWQRHYWLFGYPAAIDHRLTALYGAFLLGGLLFALLRHRLQPLSWRLYLLFAVAPMALDGFSQLFGFRESNWLLRTITGALFSLGTVWLTYPYIEKTMAEIRQQAGDKLGKTLSQGTDDLL